MEAEEYAYLQARTRLLEARKELRMLVDATLTAKVRVIEAWFREFHPELRFTVKPLPSSDEDTYSMDIDVLFDSGEAKALFFEELTAYLARISQ